MPNPTDIRIIKKKLTDNELAIEMRKLWDKGERAKTNFYELLRTTHKISKTRCLKAYDIMEQIATKEVLSAQSEANIQASLNSSVMGIKTKNDRLLILQTEVDNCLNELSEDTEYDHIVISGKVQKVSRQMTVIERTKLRQTAKDLQSEISKIEGDYAETSIKLKGDKDNPVFDLRSLHINFK